MPGKKGAMGEPGLKGPMGYPGVKGLYQTLFFLFHFTLHDLRDSVNIALYLSKKCHDH